MSNLTFDEKLIREHKPEALEGHTVVVLERVGDLGEKFHSLLEPGDPPPRRGLHAELLRTVYLAFAVDRSRDRTLDFQEHVVLAVHVPDLDLRCTVRYTVADPRLLVASRTSDPLRRVREKVAELVTNEVALSWADGRLSFRAEGESIVAAVLPELSVFAREYGVSITAVNLRAGYPDRETGSARRIVERYGFERGTAGAGAVVRGERPNRGDTGAAAGPPEEDLFRIRLRDGLNQVRRAEHTVVRDDDDSATARGDTLYRVWYATNRRANGGGRAGFGARMDNRVHLGGCDVRIPASHKIGSLGSSWVRRILTGTDDRLRVKAVIPMETDAFWTGVQASAAAFPAEQRHALVFIHGYRVSFRDAAIRAAQLGYDLGVKGPVAFFSWPSRATLLGYGADGSAVEASEGAITDFLMHFARNCGADRVHVIAHSMGNRPLLRALQRIFSAAEREPAVRFGHLVLAAPDVTRELFLEVAEQYRRLSHRTTLYVSDEDLALRTSYRLQGARVGLAPPVTCVEGIDTVHVANVDRTLLGHSTFAQARPILYDIHALINYDAPPEQRAGLLPRRQGDERYWEVRA